METCARNGLWCLWCGDVSLSAYINWRLLTPALAASSAADEISGETVAIKQVTRVFDKAQLAKRALREITLLRHFANHENITGMIDLDAISADFNEM
jgi:hypothetical protein